MEIKTSGDCMVKNTFNMNNWQVKKIGVIGPGIVGMPMAALLANGAIKIGRDEPVKVIVVQRNSPTSGWKVGAINSGNSVIGGVEPDLDKIVNNVVSEGLLSATHDYNDLRDADVVLVCVQTDKKGFGPDYGPMFGALHELGKALKNKPDQKVPLIIFESTLAPSSMATVVKDHFSQYGLEEGKDILLGNSPNRVMPGRLVERVRSSDKIIGGLQPQTPQMIQTLYSNIVTKGTLYPTNSLTAEVVKTLENAYRDVRIAYAAEIVRYCDKMDIDFYQVRDIVNDKLSQLDGASNDPNVVPSGGLLVPTIGVGGHCLPKDGILLWWRKIESGADTSQSLIINARNINDQSPAETIKLAERSFGNLDGKSVALLGTAYRFNSEDTRNSPTLTLAKLLLDKKCSIRLHDPFVKFNDQNILKYDLQSYFTQDLKESLKVAEFIFLCTAHKVYYDNLSNILSFAPKANAVIDGCNIYDENNFVDSKIAYTGIGRGKNNPSEDFIEFVYEGFQIVETGFANELLSLINFLNDNFADNEFNNIDFTVVQKLAASCGTGCQIVDFGPIMDVPKFNGFSSILVENAKKATFL